MRTCGRVPWQSPPSHTVRTGQEISVRRLTVKQIWIVFHDELYLATEASKEPSSFLYSADFSGSSLGQPQMRQSHPGYVKVLDIP